MTPTDQTPTPRTDNERIQALYEEALAKKIQWFKDCEAGDVRVFKDMPEKEFLEGLQSLRFHLPSACHGLVNAAVDRLTLATARAEKAEKALALYESDGIGDWSMDLLADLYYEQKGSGLIDFIVEHMLCLFNDRLGKHGWQRYESDGSFEEAMEYEVSSLLVANGVISDEDYSVAHLELRKQLTAALAERDRAVTEKHHLQHDVVTMTVWLNEKDAQITALNAQLQTTREALERIRAHKPNNEQVERLDADLKAHSDSNCTECKRWFDMNHPIQRACDDWYRIWRRREAAEKHAVNVEQYDMRDIARKALALTSPPPVVRSLTVPVDVWNVMHELSVSQDLTLEQVLKQAVRNYQLHIAIANDPRLKEPIKLDFDTPTEQQKAIL